MATLCFAEINVDNLKHNVSRIRELAPQSKIIAMLKANAYGHGMIPIAQSLNNVDVFGVARLNEAVLLREAGIVTPILLLEGFIDKEELSLVDKYHLDFVVHQHNQLTLLEQQPLLKPRKAWLKIDSGMHRLGIHPCEFNDFYQRLSICSSVEKPIGFMTHFAKADEYEDDFTRKQIDCFNETIKGNIGPLSLANSAAIMVWPNTQKDYVRPGIMLYGISPFAKDNGLLHNLKPVMTLKAEIISIKSVKRGEHVGYGGTWCCPEDTNIGIVAIGYGDGYPRYIQNGAPVLLGESYAPLAGRVSMDMITIDLVNHPEAKVGDIVTLWGKGLPIEEIARKANTSPYELLCGVTQRVKYYWNA